MPIQWEWSSWSKRCVSSYDTCELYACITQTRLYEDFGVPRDVVIRFAAVDKHVGTTQNKASAATLAGDSGFHYR